MQGAIAAGSTETAAAGAELLAQGGNAGDAAWRDAGWTARDDAGRRRTCAWRHGATGRAGENKPV